MKQYLIFALLLGLFQLNAQDYNYELRQETASFNVGNVPAYFLHVEDADQDIISDVTKNYTKDHSKKIKLNRKTKEFEVQSLLVPNTNETVDMFITYGSTADGTSITTALRKSDGSFVSEDDAETNAAVMAMLTDLAKKTKVEGIQRELDAETKVLSGYEKDLKKLKGDKDKLEKTISKCKGDIKSAERDIVEINGSKERLIALLNPSDDDNAITYTSDQIDDFRKDLKKLEKKESSMTKTINKCTEKIAQSESDIPVNEQAQVDASEKIELQREVIGEVQERLQAAIKE